MTPAEMQAIQLLIQAATNGQLAHLVETTLMSLLAAGIAWLAAPAHQATLEHTIMAQPWTPTWLKSITPSLISGAVGLAAWHAGADPVPALVGATALAGFTHMHNESDQAASSEESLKSKMFGMVLSQAHDKMTSTDKPIAAAVAPEAPAAAAPAAPAEVEQVKP